tara:strand:+ start:986 stop:1792 length:807 start_codon:yes stop_codon:yes gene_type:complete
MPTNVYFDHGTTSEQRLYEDLIIEQLKIYGQDVYYLPRTVVNEDSVLGEDTSSKFTDAYAIEMYVENTDGFAGEQEIIRKFGLELRDDITLVVSKTRWLQTTEIDNNLIEDSRPNEGDLVWFPRVNAFFEIQFVEHEAPFYQVHDLPTFKLRCTKWEYSSEEVSVGHTEIDAVEDNLSTNMLDYQVNLEAGTASSGSIMMESDIPDDKNFILLETAPAELGEKQVVDQSHKFEAASGVTTTSDSTDDILDFSERNPFGETDYHFGKDF